MGADQYGYAYDPIGNRLTSTKNQATTTYTANPLNQYTAISGDPDPTYDDDGNMLALRSLGEGGTSQSDWTCQWDAKNRLIEAVQTPVQTGSKKLAFAYDYMSRRYSKKVYVYTAASEYELQSSTVFLYDSWNIIRELDAMNGNAVIRSHVWGLDLSQTLQGAGGVGGLLGTLTSDSSLLAACYDANGNITEYVASDGAIAAHYAYNAFGDVVASSGASAGDFPHHFSTKYQDDETSLYYYGFRYYAPEMGRWTTRDPLEEVEGLNLLSFVENRPVDSYDLLGMAGCVRVPANPIDTATCEELEQAKRCFEKGRDDTRRATEEELYGNRDELFQRIREKGSAPVGELGRGVVGEGKKLPERVQQIVHYYEIPAIPFNRRPENRRHPGARMGDNPQVNAKDWGEAEVQRLNNLIAELEAKIAEKKCCDDKKRGGEKKPEK